MNKTILILKKELKEVFRDKKSLMMMLITPIIIPVMLVMMSYLFNDEVNKPISDYNKVGINYTPSIEEKSILDNLEVDVTILNEEELKKKYQDGDIDVYVTKKDNNYIINYNSDVNSSYAKELVESYLNIYKEYLEKSYLESINVVESDVLDIITINENNISESNFYSDYIVNYAFIFILMAITVSATYPATDATAGEKERGTLETLLTFPVTNKNIILGKYLSVSLSSIVTGLISLILMVLSLNYCSNNYDIYKDASIILNYKQVIYSILTIVSYSFMISGLCIFVASKSKSFKEAQSALTPLNFIAFIPGMLTLMLDIKTNVFMYLIPFLNYSLLFNDISKGVLDFIGLGLMLVSTVILVFIVLKLIVKEYKSEKVLFGK